MLVLTGQKWPTGQGMGVIVPLPLQKKDAGQPRHCDWPNADWYRPDGHAIGCDDPVGQYDPSVHSSEELALPAGQ